MTLLDMSYWTGQIYMGTWRAGGGGAARVVSPSTGEELGRIGIASSSDVDEAARRAGDAQEIWAGASATQRAAVLRRAGDLWHEYAAEIENWLKRESGSVSGKAHIETHVAAAECYEAACLATEPYGALIPTEQPRLSMTRRVPVGVVGVIAPFNFPLVLAIRSVAPALALGNAVLLKPDPRTAVSGGVALARVFDEAGLPPGLFAMLPGGTDVGEAIVDHPDVSAISFTGSTSAGRKVAQSAARNLKRVHLELGGNSAIIVLDDVDLDRATSAAAWGSFLHQGQICMTTGRHIVHASLYAEFVELLSTKAEALTVGNPESANVALGPLIDAGQRDKVHHIVTSSVAAGARLAAGGTFEGLFYRPTVLSHVTPETPAYAEEVFGPVAPVIPFSSLDEAIALAAASDYGLSLSIMTRDIVKGLAVADRIPTGMVHINDQTVTDEANAPFGGTGASGNGARFGGRDANLNAFTNTRWVTVRGEIPGYPP